LAPADYSVKLAQINNQRGFWEVKAAINNILLEIDLAYWGLVSAAENLTVVIENTKLLGLLESSFNRRYEQTLITSFDKLQFDSEIAQAKLDEELALDNYYRASTALAGMLTDNPEEVFDYILLPVGFSYDYSGLTTPLVGEVQEVALKKRPEISAQKLDLEAKNLNLYFSENRLLPDVRFNISGTFSQNGSTYGYKDIARSLEGLASPDAIDVNTSIAHTSALGRRSDKANLRVAEVNVVAGNYSVRGLKNSVKRQVSDAHIIFKRFP
jgi:outer membrane protein TolC